MKLKKYEYVNQEIESKEFQLPSEPIYFFETGVRRSIRITPIFVEDWKENGDVDNINYYIEVVFVYNSFDCKIESITFPITDIEKYYYNDKDKLHEFIVDWVNGNLSVRTKKQFESDLEMAINKIKHIV